MGAKDSRAIREARDETTVTALKELLILWEIRTGKQLPRRCLSFLFASKYLAGREGVELVLLPPRIPEVPGPARLLVALSRQRSGTAGRSLG